MSYLSQPTSTIDYGVVKVGSYINVTNDGIISIGQDVDPAANVSFSTVSVSGSLTSAGKEVVTSVTPTSGSGILISGIVPVGPNAAFTITNTGVLSLNTSSGLSVNSNTGNVVITNTGVLSLIAGPGISLTSNTGNITVSATGADLINVYGTSTSYTATLNDEYIGVSSVTAVTITLPTGVNGRVYYIKDEYGQGSGKITIQPQTGQLIDGKTNYIISVPYQCVATVFRANSWWIM